MLKENLLWVRRLDTVEELRLTLHAFRATYNQTWIVERPQRPSEWRSLRRSRPPHKAAMRCLTTADRYDACAQASGAVRRGVALASSLTKFYNLTHQNGSPVPLLCPQKPVPAQETAGSSGLRNRELLSVTRERRPR